ncbi:circularly permuted type 2 ATP-grasp protein [Gordonia sp. ABSL1-1]|uniref:circularly permuted type 2 ATP-grasp protein n=1 Tax=Gordonia sp. ABSL1-1 TaxID=3053923 RepID=UPI0025744043|nr:circularly permuted type 2 ATP-grasp protein [Gordonia sp. ABSL1-1]MDL9937298.1 circularly permuted type 2 ATP-grasp protein [Gordonia sp. ABSL1-1]
MTSSSGSVRAVFERYRTDGFTLFDLAEIDGASTAKVHYDEMLDPAGAVRSAWTDLAEGYEIRGEARLRNAAARLAAAVEDEGVVYNEFVAHGSGPGETVARDWQIDPVPLIVDGSEWSELEKALTQRSMLLDLLLRDLYRDQKTISAGLVPPQMVFGHPGYIRKAARLEVAGPHALFLHAADIGRTADGRFVVYGDRTQAPSGIGYAIVDRRLTSRIYPQLFQSCAPRATSTFAGTLRLALFDYAPPGVDDPTVAVFSPGSMSETAFDQAYLASVLGFPLVEGADLTVRDGVVYMRSLGRFKRVDVLLRRVDAAYADPLDLRTGSRLGVTGLVEAISRGNVTVVNTLGSGVLENPALHTVLDRVAPMLLDEELALPSVQTYWGGDDLDRTKMIADVGGLAFTNIRTGAEIVGGFLDTAGREGLIAQLRAQTWQWVGRALETYSVAPSMTPGVLPAAPNTSVRAAPVALRAFSVAQGHSYAVMPGALGSVLADGLGGAAHHTVAAKDVWVTNAEVGGHESRRSETRVEPAQEVPVVRVRISSSYSEVAAAASPRVLADLFWLGRYGERTELTTRLAKVSRERYQDFQYRPWMSGTAAVPALLHAVATITGTAGYLSTADLLDATDRPPSPDQVSDAIVKITDLTVARAVPGTVAHSADRLIGSVRAVRDQMSTSTWMVLAPVERALESLSSQVTRARNEPGDGTLGDAPELARTHDEVLHGVLALAGLQAESMVHDAGWMFMDIGRRIERVVTLADLTAAVFADSRDPDIEQVLLESYLAANESSVIYRRRNRGLYQLITVAELLLFDATNPRSMIYQFDRIRAHLIDLPEPLRSASAERAIEDMVAELRRGDPADLASVDNNGRRSELVELMTTLSDAARELSDLLGSTRLAPPRTAQPIWGGGDSR